MPPCLIGMEACVGAHHLSRKLKALGHEPRLMPAKLERRGIPRALLADLFAGDDEATACSSSTLN